MMTEDCYCDYDPPLFYNRQIRRARAVHKCYECANLIRAGELYEYVAAKWDDSYHGVDVFKTCQDCVDITTWVKNNVPCLCWSHGNRINDCKDAVDDATYNAPEETKGLQFGLLRRIVVRDRARGTNYDMIKRVSP